MSSGYRCQTCGKDGLQPFVKKCPYCLTNQYKEIPPHIREQMRNAKTPGWFWLIFWIGVIWFLLSL